MPLHSHDDIRWCDKVPRQGFSQSGPIVSFFGGGGGHYWNSKKNGKFWGILFLPIIPWKFCERWAVKLQPFFSTERGDGSNQRYRLVGQVPWRENPKFQALESTNSMFRPWSRGSPNSQKVWIFLRKNEDHRGKHYMLCRKNTFTTPWSMDMKHLQSMYLKPPLPEFFPIKKM